MLIGLCGKPQSGKSQVRKIMMERYKYITINTKHHLAEACGSLTGLAPELFLSQEGKSTNYKGVELRTIMGNVQDSMEAMFGDYHSIQRSLSYYNITDYIVVDSLRKTQPLHFPGLIVEVVSHRSVDTGYSFDLYIRDRIDYTLDNNGTVADLRDNLDKMFGDLGIRFD